MLQHGDFFENLFVAAATVLREGFAADEERRDSFVCSIAGDPWRFVFLLSSILLLERICVRDLGVATDQPAPDHLGQYQSVLTNLVIFSTATPLTECHKRQSALQKEERPSMPPDARVSRKPAWSDEEMCSASSSSRSSVERAKTPKSWWTSTLRPRVRRRRLGGGEPSAWHLVAVSKHLQRPDVQGWSHRDRFAVQIKR